MSGTDLSLHAVIHGLVQGVGYRMFTQREARRLSLHGWVRNLSDGSVEVVAEGSENRLIELLGRLRQGPAGGHVTGVDLEWGDAGGSFTGFSIRY